MRILKHREVKEHAQVHLLLAWVNSCVLNHYTSLAQGQIFT